MAITDTFESYTDGQTLTAQTNWTAWSAVGSGVMTIDTHTDHKSGQVVDMSTTGTQFAVWQGGQVGSDDHYVEISSFPDSGNYDSNPPGDGCGSGPLLRMQASSPTSPSGYLVLWLRVQPTSTNNQDSHLILYRVDSGVLTELEDSGNIEGTYSPTVPHTITATIDGATITATIDGGADVIDYDTTSDGTKYTTGEYVGVYQRRDYQDSGTNWQPFFDDFEADTLDAPEPLDPASVTYGRTITIG